MKFRLHIRGAMALKRIWGWFGDIYEKVFKKERVRNDITNCCITVNTQLTIITNNKYDSESKENFVD